MTRLAPEGVRDSAERCRGSERPVLTSSSPSSRVHDTRARTVVAERLHKRIHFEGDADLCTGACFTDAELEEYGREIGSETPAAPQEGGGSTDQPKEKRKRARKNPEAEPAPRKRKPPDEVVVQRGSKDAMQQRELLRQIHELRYARSEPETLSEKGRRLKGVLDSRVALRPLAQAPSERLPDEPVAAAVPPSRRDDLSARGSGRKGPAEGAAADGAAAPVDVVDLVSEDEDDCENPVLGSPRRADAGAPRAMPVASAAVDDLLVELGLRGDLPRDVHGAQANRAVPAAQHRSADDVRDPEGQAGTTMLLDGRGDIVQGGPEVAGAAPGCGVTEEHELALETWPMATMPKLGAAATPSTCPLPPVPAGQRFSDIYDVVLLIDNREQVR